MNNSAKFSRRILNKILTTTGSHERRPLVTSGTKEGRVDYSAPMTVLNASLKVSVPQLGSKEVLELAGVGTLGASYLIFTESFSPSFENDFIVIDASTYRIQGLAFQGSSHTEVIAELSG